MFHVHLTAGALAALAVAVVLVPAVIALLWLVAGPATALLLALVVGLVVHGVRSLLTPN